MSCPRSYKSVDNLCHNFFKIYLQFKCKKHKDSQQFVLLCCVSSSWEEEKLRKQAITGSCHAHLKHMLLQLRKEIYAIFLIVHFDLVVTAFSALVKTSEAVLLTVLETRRNITQRVR